MGQYCVQLAKMGQSLKRDQVVTIAETMIKRMNMESEFLEMKRQRLWLDDNPDVQEEQPKLVGSKWHISFMNRHKASIVEKVGHLTHTGHHHLVRTCAYTKKLFYSFTSSFFFCDIYIAKIGPLQSYV